MAPPHQLPQISVKWGVFALNKGSKFWDCQDWSTRVCAVLGYEVKSQEGREIGPADDLIYWYIKYCSRFGTRILRSIIGIRLGCHVLSHKLYQ